MSLPSFFLSTFWRLFGYFLCRLICRVCLLCPLFGDFFVDYFADLFSGIFAEFLNFPTFLFTFCEEFFEEFYAAFLDLRERVQFFQKQAKMAVFVILQLCSFSIPGLVKALD